MGFSGEGSGLVDLENLPFDSSWGIVSGGSLEEMSWIILVAEDIRPCHADIHAGWRLHLRPLHGRCSRDQLATASPRVLW